MRIIHILAIVEIAVVTRVIAFFPVVIFRIEGVFLDTIPTAGFCTVVIFRTGQRFVADLWGRCSSGTRVGGKATVNRQLQTVHRAGFGFEEFRSINIVTIPLIGVSSGQRDGFAPNIPPDALHFAVAIQSVDL